MQGLNSFFNTLSRKLCTALILGVGFSPAVFAADPPPSYASSADNQTIRSIDGGSGTAGVTSPIDEYIRGKMVEALGFSVYDEGGVTSSPQTDFVNQHLTVYCSPSLKSENSGSFKCSPPSQGFTASDKKMMELGDISFYTLIGNDLYTVANAAAAQNLIRNIVNPFPSTKYQDYVSSGNMTGTQQQSYANYMAGQVILGVALNSLTNMYSARVPASMIDKDASATASFMSAMQNEAQRRFIDTDGKFKAFLDKATTDLVSSTTPLTPEAVLLKELLAMESFRMWMDFEKYKQMERVEALLAASLSKYVVSSYASDKVMSGMPSKGN